MVEVRKLLGRHMETTLEVVDFEPDRGFAVKVVSGPLKFRASYDLEPANGSTKLQFVLEGDPEKFFRFDEPARRGAVPQPGQGRLPQPEDPARDGRGVANGGRR